MTESTPEDRELLDQAGDRADQEADNASPEDKDDAERARVTYNKHRR